jgi:hypothetical protein
MAAIVYLDVEDEITSAASRIRSGEETRVALVVPYGSRLATSRINFRLLAREAQTRGRRLAIVAGDAATRALAASAGLPVFGSVGEYEGAEEAGTGAKAPDAIAASPVGAPTTATDSHSPPPDPEATVLMTVPVADTGALHGAAGDEVAAVPPYIAPRERSEPRDRSIPVAQPARQLPIGRTALIAIAAALAFVVLVGGVAGYLLLPWASVTVTAQAQAIAPVELTVRADPAAVEVDPTAGVVPARRLEFELDASDTFPATGVRVEEAAATGEVLFQSKDPTDENPIPNGAIVSTSNGVRFRTLAAVSVPRATIVGLTIIPGEARVAIRAVEAGTAGNVQPNAITVIPQGEDPLLTSVTNPEATAGGRRDEFTLVDQADIDAAVEALTGRIQADFQAIVADPATVPEGMTLFPETATSTTPEPTVALDTLVGQEVPSFDLGMTASGSVIAVDESPLEEIARARIRARVQAGHRLVDDSIEVSPAEARVDGEIVTFTMTASASQIRILDAADLRELVRGKPVAEARALLEPFGEVEIETWPDWVTSVPTIDGRFELTVDTDIDADTDPSPSGSARPASPRPSVGGSAAPSSAPGSGAPSPASSAAP